jgi:hypothetical protein
MIKYWLVIFTWTTGPNPEFVEKHELAFQTKAACEFSLKNSPMYSPVHIIKGWCITNDHREGKTLDKNVPLEPTPF